jgi:hypothetical protein
MRTHSLNLFFAVLAVAAVAGCPSSVTVDETSSGGCDPAYPTCVPCALDTDCPNNGICTNGVCGEGLPVGSTGSNGGGSGGDECTQTTDCAIDEMCNGATHLCTALPDGWCRQASDCSGGTPLCSAQTSNVPGVCVECLDDGDCASGGRCGGGGVCAGGASSCPPNSSRSSSGACTCNAGFHLDTTTHTCETDQASTGCVANAHPVPGQAGRCECDTGYVQSPSGNACVRPTSGGGSSGGGSTGGGSTGGDSGGDDSIIGDCGPNTIAIFFVCFCMPGYVEDPSGAEGCVEDTGATDDGSGDTGGVDDGSGDTGTGDTGTGDSGDVCEDNGWYGDGVCDELCAQPDPDCDNGGATPGGESDVCADNGWYGDGVCDDFCDQPEPDCGSEP